MEILVISSHQAYKVSGELCPVVVGVDDSGSAHCSAVALDRTLDEVDTELKEFRTL